jgi:hypothetical protein
VFGLYLSLIQILTTYGRSAVFMPWLESAPREIVGHYSQLGEGPISACLIFSQETGDGEIQSPESISAICDNSASASPEESPKLTEGRFSMEVPVRPMSSPLYRFDPEDFYGFENSDWFFSEQSLKGLVGVQTCKDPQREDDATGGLFLHYTDRKEVLGQLRPDWRIGDMVERPIAIAVRRYFYSNRKIPSVQVKLYTEANAADMVLDDVVWKHVDLQERMCWWFSIYGDVVDILHADGAVA